MAQPLRELRRFITRRATELGVGLSPFLPLPIITAVERGLARAGPFVPRVGRQVARNLRAAGIDAPAVRHEYFARVAAHLAGGLRIFHYVRRVSADGGPMPPGLAQIVEREIQVDATLERLRGAAAGGRGAIVIGAHIANFLLVLARINQELPLTVYLRHSADPARMAAKEMWCRATGLRYIAEPARLTDPTHRAALMSEALRAGQVLIITPDLPQKRGAGVPVRFLDRELYLPTGAAALSVLTGASLVAAIARPSETVRGLNGLSATCVTFEGPLAAETTGSGRGWKQAAIAARMQWFADHLARFVRTHPALWFLWGDNRWSRVFSGDERYGRLLRPQSNASHPATPGLANAAESA
ncbi:MAG: hypothetical protein U1A27_07805 [Phycisphaerae bacterium]